MKKMEWCSAIASVCYRPKKRGYYREYTVASANTRDRGARRIVCGGQATAPDNCYYTDDHYASFRRIVP